jgi:hypothetical protein
LERTRIGDLATVRQGLNTSGRGAGARPGSWRLQLVNGGDIQEDRIVTDDLDIVEVEQNAKTEKHLLRPYDLILTAKSTSLKAALVPPSLTPAVANATLLVVRPQQPEVGVYLWWFATSKQGRQLLESRMVGSVTIWSLPPSAVQELEVPVPATRELYLIAQLVEESERAYAAATEAAKIRRNTIRDHVIGTLLSNGLEGGA